MKKIVLLVLVHFLFLSLNAQNWEWAVSSTSITFGQSATQLTTDNSGNIYLLGTNTGKAAFGGILLSKGAFVVKYSSSGSVLWAKNISYYPILIKSDVAGNIFLCGTYAIGLNTGSTVFSSKGEDDIFLVKLDPSGNELWARSYGNTYDSQVGDLAIDKYGNSYLAAKYIGDTLSFYNYSAVQANGNSKIALAKIDPAGVTQWVTRGIKTSDTEYYYNASAIALDNSNNIYMVGRGVFCAAGCAESMLAKFDSQGNQYYHKWVDYPYSSNNYSNLKLDKLNNIYVFNYDNYSKTFMKCDSDMNEIWAVPGGIYRGCFGFKDFDIDETGNSFLAGYLYYDPEYSCSNTPGFVEMNGQLYPVKGGADFFVQTMDASGNVTGVKHALGNNDQSLSDILVKSGEACYVAGIFNNSASTNYYTDTLIFDNHTLTNQASYSQAFVARLGVSNLVLLPENRSVVFNSISIYPNPSAGIITVVSDKQLELIEVYNAFGQKVTDSRSTKNMTEIDLRSEQKGIYFVNFSTGDQWGTKKVMIR